jgi:hypothetical protein
MSTNKDTEHRLTKVEIKVLEHCSDIKSIHGEIDRVEDKLSMNIKLCEERLREEIRENRTQIMKIMKNELPHLEKAVFSSRWNLIKLIGSIAGLVSGIYIILINISNIAEVIWNFLSIFFQ